jgi:hypothetical protein
MFLLPTMGEAKNWYPYDNRGHVRLSFSHLWCLIWISWASWQGFSSLGSVQHFHFQILLFAYVTKLKNTRGKGQLILGAQNMTRLRTVQNTGDFFLPKNRWILYEFVHLMINFNHPFLPHLNLVLHNIYFTLFIQMLSIYFIFFTVNKAW